MPSHLPSSFASAAAGQPSRDTRASARAGEPRGSGDWARKEARTLNGTLTLRRSSANPNAASAQSSVHIEQSTSDSIFAQYTSSTVAADTPADARYSKDKILDIYKSYQAVSVSSNDDVARLYVNNWNPEQSNNSTGRGWGKVNDSRDNNHAPEICWDQSGDVPPIGLEEMSELEKTIFASDVNSPLKPPPQNISKEQGTPGTATNGRKVSVSHGQGAVGSFGLASPTPGRPGVRRRETGDSLGYDSLTSPATASRFGRQEQSPFFARKATDKDSFGDDRDDGPTHGQSKSSLPFGGLSRSNTGGSTLGNGPSSPWTAGPANASMSPMGNFGSFALPTSSNPPATPGEKRPGFGRGESRLAHLMPKESSEDLSSKTEGLRSDAAKSWRARTRTETDPFDDEHIQGGSAALGGQDISPPLHQQRRAPGLDTPSRQTSSDFGMSDMTGFRDAVHGHGIQTPHGRQGSQREPESPTETNPYASPAEERTQRDEDDHSVGSDAMHHIRASGLGGVPEHPSNPFGGMSRGFPGAPFDGSDRSQTSSAAGNKGFPSLGSLSGLSGLGNLGGWPTSANPIGTPDRERSFQGAFGNPIFGPMGGDVQSPSLGSLGGFGPATGGISGSNTIGRGSKLGSLFPAAMQAQMHSSEVDHQDEPRQSTGFGAIGRNAFGPPRETGSPLRSGRGVFDDLFQASDFRQGSFSSAEAQQSQNSAISQGPSTFTQAPGQAYQQSQASSDPTPTPSHLPQTQQRTMVMPDRMRWVYLDPQGQTQGPWSGLEMHDWYKAAFFTPDLSVKKLEDAEFEPLGQLIRRIGNSREPFLVPQIGVPHGPATTQSGAPFAPAVTAGTSGPQPGAVQPPFAGAFPSFGTTLTAEQQNNLERRKQEEQYLMARQREFLAQQQVNMKQMQMQGGLPSVLHHHSSAHSLQSQPSFGSISSPIGPIMPQQQIATGPSSFFDTTPRPVPGPGNMNLPPDFFREEEIARLTIQDRQSSFGILQPGRAQLPPMFSQQPQGQSVVAPAQQQTLNENDPQGFRARLQEFEQLRAQHDAEQAAQQASASAVTEPIGPPHHRQQAKPAEDTVTVSVEEKTESKEEQETLSLTEQIQKAASAKAAPQPESPWAKVSSGLPMPFPPPPQSSIPLAAPAAQRGRSNLPETLHAGTRSRSQTPDAATAAPSIAPWAKESTETPKGPSLKEIQEAEAKKAAKLEEAAAAARRALLEQELRAQPAVVAPGLPTTSTWASSVSPASPAAPAASAWAKATNIKAQSPASTSAPSKKTLADIQKEEELRKQKIAAAAALTAAPTFPGPISGGKRYADLASKPTATAVATSSAWSTVGAGGKVKIPIGPSVVTPSVARPASTAAVPTLAKVVRPTIADMRSTTSGAALATQSGVSAAQQEFTKWAKAALAKGLNTDINVDDFVQMLCEFPGEPGVIADSVYANSQLMDGRRFADEFLRRKKLAEKGIVENASAGSTGFSTAGASGSASAGGWSEVAKKGPPKVEEPAAGFKVVPNKKKGRK